MDSMNYVVTVVVHDEIDFATLEDAEMCLKKLADIGFYGASIVLQSVELKNREYMERLAFGDICHKGEKNVKK